MLCSGQNSHGFCLLEVLIALAILAVCLLGIVGMENAAFKRTYDAYLRSVAVNQVNNMVERIHAGIIKECTVWIEENKKLLPRGYGKCSYSKVSVCWQYTEKQECEEVKL